MSTDTLLAALTPQARNEPDSGIVKAAMYGFTVPGVIPLWTGEGNQPTPEAFARPAAEALLNGETFYTWQRGIPELREALARYHARSFGRSFDPESFFVTSGGMHAIQTIVQLIAGDGDEIIIPPPGPTTRVCCASRARNLSRCRCISAMASGRSISTVCSMP